MCSICISFSQFINVPIRYPFVEIKMGVALVFYCNFFIKRYVRNIIYINIFKKF